MRRSIALAAALFWALASTAAAQDPIPPTETFSVMRFTPVPGGGNYLSVDGARVRGHLAPSVGLTLDYAHEPFTLYTAQCAAGDPTDCEVTGTEAQLVEYAFTASLLGAINLIDRIQIGLVLPFALSHGEGFQYTPEGSSTAVAVQSGGAFALADPMLRVKGRIFGEPGDALGFAAVLYLTAPIGQAIAEDHFLGEPGVTFGGHVVGEFVERGIRVAGNLGARYRPEATLFSTEVGPQITYAIAGGYDVTPLVTVFAEFEGGSTFTTQVDENPLEGRIAGRLRQGDFFFTAAVGTGLISGVGVPVFRGIAQATWAPERVDSDGDRILDAADGCPAEAEDLDGWMDEDGCPEEDNDSDGMLDTVDPCPTEAEDRDGHEDEDGCPDRDNDGDGVQDGYDSCPTEPEDMDGDRDEDGCPDADTDRDGIADAQDACPDQPEDTDGFGDEDGCPETDFDSDGVPDDRDECPDQPELINGLTDDDGCPEEDSDADGIPNEQDRCPNEAETLNGNADDDGCPDGPAVITLDANRIVPAQQLVFDRRGQLAGRVSRQVLDAVATLVRRSPHLGRLRVEVHSDARGTVERTQAMADNVVAYLVSKGVPQDRLQAVGIGPARPDGDEPTNRVELHFEPPPPPGARPAATPAPAR